MKVTLLYFKAWGGGPKELGGKYYSGGEYDSEKDYFDVLDEVQKMRDEGRLPGLVEGHSAYHVLVTREPETVPHLLVAPHFINPNAA